jgi:hypothetical protein
MGSMFLLQEMQKDFQHIDYEVSWKDVWDWERKNIILERMQMDGGIDNKTF